MEDLSHFTTFSSFKISGASSRAPSKKLSVWQDRYSEANRTSPGRFSSTPRPRPLQTNRPPSARTAFGGGPDRFAWIQSNPGSPMTDVHTRSSWFVVRDIDIGDSGGGGSLQSQASLNRSHFAFGSSSIVSAGKNSNLGLLQLDDLQFRI